MLRVLFIVVSISLFSASAAHAQTSHCKKNEGALQLSFTKDGNRLAKKSFQSLGGYAEYDESDRESGAGVIHWRGDLNSDGVEDFVFYGGMYGSRSQVYMVVASCGSKKHRTVFNDYIWRIEVEPRNEFDSWRTIVLKEYDLATDVFCNKGGSNFGSGMLLHHSAYRFVDGTYKRARHWQSIEAPEACPKNFVVKKRF